MFRLPLLILFIFSSSALFCTKPQRNGWISFEALSSRDHVTQVFEAISPNISSSDPYTTDVNGTSYTISEFTARTYYNDANQKDSYVSDNVANVSAGSLTVAFHFNYSFSGVSGYAQGHVVTEPFWFTKKLFTSDGFISWEAVQINNISIISPFTISYSNPKLPATALSAYQQIINNQTKESNRLKDNLVNQINKLYNAELINSLHNQDLIKINNITYKYKNVTFQYTSAVIDLKLSNVGFKGLYYSFLFELANYTTECNDLPTKYNDSLGGVQSYFGMSWIKSTAAKAASEGLFDATLDSKWDIEMFQFYMGDLTNIIDEAKKYPPTTPLTGTCKYNRSSQISITVEQTAASSLQISIPYECKIYANETLIQSISFSGIFVQRFGLNGKQMVTSISYAGMIGTTFKKEGEFEVKNSALASQYIKNILNSLVGKPALGDKFQTLRMNRGSMGFTNSYVYMFDPSQK